MRLWGPLTQSWWSVGGHPSDSCPLTKYQRTSMWPKWWENPIRYITAVHHLLIVELCPEASLWDNLILGKTHSFKRQKLGLAGWNQNREQNKGATFINNIAVGVPEFSFWGDFGMLTRDFITHGVVERFITPYVIFMFELLCSSRIDYHRHCPMGTWQIHIICPSRKAFWVILRWSWVHFVGRAVMIGSQATFLPHVY